jgi:predicted RNA-binding protein with PIN domain
VRIMLVDGYNIIHAWPRLAALLEPELERAREELVSSLTPLADLDDFQVWVVFDAGTGGRPFVQLEERGSLKVLFSRQGQSADSLIEALARRMADNYEVSVATGDRAEGDMAFFHGARVLSAAMLAREVERAEKDIVEESERLRGEQRPPRLEERVPEEVRLLLDELRFRR